VDELKRLVIINAARYVVGFPQCAGCVYLQPDVATCSRDGFTECGEPELRLRGELAAAILALIYEHGARRVVDTYEDDDANKAVALLVAARLAKFEATETDVLRLTPTGEIVARKNQDNGYNWPEVK
jgi:hypothetical protein